MSASQHRRLARIAAEIARRERAAVSLGKMVGRDAKEKLAAMLYDEAEAGDMRAVGMIMRYKIPDPRTPDDGT